MELSTHLLFDGDCEKAFLFYEPLLGGEIVTMLSYGDSPMAGDVPDMWRSKIIHGNDDARRPDAERCRCATGWLRMSTRFRGARPSVDREGL